jgi:AMMECR1 domain-containing protein
LLTDFEDAEHYLDWTVGVHGIYITFTHPFYTAATNNSSNTPLSTTPTGKSTSKVTKRNYTATYLPDVMPAQGWTKVEAVDSAMRKAGWDGAINDDLRRSVKLRRYQSSKTFVNWKEYAEWRVARGGVMVS